MKTLSSLLTCFCFSCLLTTAGCQSPEQQPYPPKTAPKSAQPEIAKKPSTIVIPDLVKGRWKAVRVVVTDKKNDKDTTYTIPIGGTVKFADSKMSIEVEAFLPAFVMQGSVMTSASNDLKNPAAKVKISDADKGIFSGWLFAKYPTTHAFIHPRFGFKLVDAVPAR